jgi:hypothetical protein
VPPYRHTMSNEPVHTSKPDRRALRILARSLARDFEAQGFEARVLVMLASELIEEASQRIRSEVVAGVER